MRKVKCKICGLKDYFDDSKVTEFWASRFLYIHINKNKDWLSSENNHFICRKCLVSILDALRFESHKIEDLYKPQIKFKEDSEVSDE